MLAPEPRRRRRASSLRERAEPGEAGGLTSAHAGRQEREHHSEDVAGERHERDEADQHAERAHVGADAEARGAATEGTDDDGCRGQRAENASDRARDRFRRAGDQQADRAAERGADDRRRADAEDVRCRESP